MSFNISWSDESSVRIAAIDGKIDSTNSHVFKDVLKQGCGTETDALVLDLAGVSFMSSAGLRVLLGVAKTFVAPKTLAVCELNTLLAEIFTISGFNQIVAVYPTRTAALSALKGG